MINDLSFIGWKILKKKLKRKVNVFNIRPVEEDSLRLGQLKGNHFDIVIRNLKNQINDSANLRERILEAIENVKVRKLHCKSILGKSLFTLRYEGNIFFCTFLFVCMYNYFKNW